MERQIAEMKIEEEELKRRIALLTAEGEMEKAEGLMPIVHLPIGHIRECLSPRFSYADSKKPLGI